MMSKIKSSKIANGKILIGILLAVCLIAVFACDQKKLAKSTTDKVNSEKVDDEVYMVVEDMPEYPGGFEALSMFLAQNVKYPVEAQKKGVQGAVYVTFVVNKDGSVSDAKFVRGVDPLLDAEAIRVVSLLANWKPGKQRGENVRVSLTLPINFALQ